ncbi:uncharacterized protein [Dendropsophus ebraccatus]|uniref:uncharacterized protein n=1 Tax=Dendropsophus ebraccatus TaxID=150705 RepID=UPI0038313804
MPTCVVKGCTTKWRNFDRTVIMHTFPSDPQRIRKWLELTGQFTDNFEEMVEKVVKGKKSDSFRMCSRHFAYECYNYEGHRRILKYNATPSIFETEPESSAVPTRHVHCPHVKTIEKVTTTAGGINLPTTPSTTCVSYTFAQSTVTSKPLTTTTISLPIPSYFTIVPQTKSLCSEPTSEAPPCKKTKSYHAEKITTQASPQVTLIQSSTPGNLSIAPSTSMFIRPLSIVTAPQENGVAMPDNKIKRASSPTRVDVALNTNYLMLHKHKHTQTVIPTKTKKILCSRIRSVKRLSKLPSIQTSSAKSQLREKMGLLPGRLSSFRLKFPSELTRRKQREQEEEEDTNYEDIEDSIFHISDGEEDPEESFIAYSDDETEAINEFKDLADSEEDLVKEQKFIVFESSLKKLIRKIRCSSHVSCNGQLLKYKKIYNGSSVTIIVKCENGHEKILWESQPKVEGQPAGNVMIPAATILSGNNFLKIQSFFKVQNIKSVGKSVYYENQKNYIFPAIDRQWKREQEAVVEEIGTALLLTGDGLSDGPGFSGKYCLYTLMDMDCKKIVNFHVKQLIPTISLEALEKVAFKRCIEELIEKDLDIALIATDRNMSIRNLLEDEYPHIRHEFNAWHLAKSIGNEIYEASKSKDTEILSAWIKPIRRHLRWCLRTCGDDPEVLVQRWRSIIHHCANEHSWLSNSTYNRCRHPPLKEKQQKETKWLRPESPAHQTLEKIVEDPSLLEDLRQVSTLSDTREVEIFHSICLKYRPKRVNFFIDEMVARTQLAIIDHNHNVGRIKTVVKTVSGGHQVGTARHRVDYSKRERAWLVKAMYGPTCQEFLLEIMEQIYDIVRNPYLSEWVSKR